jgi:serine/threonine protein kinase
MVAQRYRLDAEIGRGGMGVVYRAHDIPNNRDAAVKVINLNTANALTFQQFEREVEIAMHLAHPHIVAAYETGVVDIGSGESSPFIVMELVMGTKLEEMRGFTFGRIVEIAQQICDALEYIHEQGFVYRDLKPGNVILEKRGFHYFVKLLDFGLARPRGEAYLLNESSLAGTVFYLAPELIAGQPADIGSDLYALGAMLYEMITGRVPFSDIDEQNIRLQHLNDTVSPPSQSRSDVPPALEAVVMKLLEKNPKDRFASARDVGHALEQVALVLDSTVRGNLPQITTELMGRENEIAQVVQLLESNQLVTLLGDSDALALAVCAQLTSQFANGLWLVQLESVNEPMMVLQTVASVLGVHTDSQRPLTVSLIEYLREKNLLLLLSHCGHVLGACSQFAETILSTCPEVRILATSSHPFNISAEKCFRQSDEAGG